MSKCKQCTWKPVAVFVGKQCVMLNRCEVCKEFGGHFCLTPKPFSDSINVDLEKLPEYLQASIKEIVARVDSYPMYSL